MAVFETVLPLVRQGLTHFNIMVEMGVINDAAVAAMTTLALARATPFAGFETQRRWYENYQKAIDRLIAIGVLTAANIGGAANVAGFQALLTAHFVGTGDAALTAAHHGSHVVL